MSKQTATGGLVYSTEHGRMCPDCRMAVTACTCAQQETIVAGDGIVRLRHETKGRKGKGVTVISGVPLAASALQQLGKQLKARCGCGGTVKDGVIEIQGEHVALLMAELQQRGWQVKRSGG